MTTITQKESAAQLMTFLKSDAGKKITYLRDRWQDEKEYEDFEEYKTTASAIFKAVGYAVYSMTKAFKIVVSRDGFEHTISIGASKVGVTTKPLPSPTKASNVSAGTKKAPEKAAKHKVPKVAPVVKKAAKEKTKRVTIGSVVTALIKAGKATVDILAAVKAEFPDAKTTDKCVSWYRSQLKNA